MTNEIGTSAPAAERIRGGAAPAWTLVFLAPFIAEVLSGATRVSVLFAIVPEMMVWGCGALLIRELVRRWRGGWPSLLCLGLALSIAEEFLIQQTSLAPLPFPGALTQYGRAGGVNWIYFLFMLGYESVWVVLVPVSLTELIFADRGKQLWLRRRGIAIAFVVFLLGCRVAWFAWIKRVRPVVFHLPPYHPAPGTLAAGVAAMALLAVLAWAVRRFGTAKAARRRLPPPPVVLLVALAFGLSWYGLMRFVFSAQPPGISFGVPIAAAIVWAFLAMVVLGRWAASPTWSKTHTWAAAFAATLVCMAAGFLGSSHWPRVDLVGKAILNVLAVIGFLWLLRRIRSRAIA